MKKIKNYIIKNKKTKFSVLCCGVLSCVCLGLGVGFYNNAKVYAETSESVEITAFLSQSYKVGDNVSFPDYVFDNNGETLVAERIVYLPSGQGYTGTSLLLSEMGEYVLTYRAKANGKVFERTETFTVSDNLYSTSGMKSDMDFGAVAEYTQYTANERTGMIVDLYQGETLEYNKVINLNEYTSGETFIDFSMLPHAMGTADANKILVTLTDIYDTSNYVTFEVRKIGTGQNFMERLSYVMAYANGQLPQALAVKAQSKADFVYEGQYYRRHLNNIYGTEVYFPMSGYSITTGTNIAMDSTKVGQQDLKLGFDYEKRRVYANGSLIIDLDDPSLQTNVWSGFTTGECRLSVSVTGYNGNSCRMLINEMDGNTTQNNDTVFDEEKPEIFVDEEELAAVTYVSVGKKVKIPNATARDSYSGVCQVRTAVYVNYDMSSQAWVDISDGAFIPVQARTYTIVYTATDKCGNTQIKTYSVEARNVSDDISLDYGSVETTAKVGQLLQIGKPLVSNAIGNYYVSVSVSKDGVAEELFAVDKTNVDALRYEWRPMEAGTYEIVYAYRDYVSSDQISYTVNVSANGEDILIGEPNLPKYIIKNAAYKTPVFEGYGFTNGKAVAKKADLYVSATANYTQADKIAGETFTVKNDAECYLSFVLGDNVKAYKIPVIDVNYGATPLALHKYFVGYSGEPQVGDLSTAYTLAERDGVYGLEFINALQTFEFKFGFTIPVDANYGKVKIILTDSVDSSQQLAFDYRKTSSSAYFSINGGTEYDLGCSFTGTSFTLNYNGAEQTVNAGIDMTYSVKTDVNGKTWNGFTSGKVWLQLLVEDLADAALPKVTVNNVNNQYVYQSVMMDMNLTSDIVEAQISTPTLKGNFAKGDVITIVPVEYGDVLDPNPTATLNVMGPNGQNVTANDGTVLAGITDIGKVYQIQLYDYGTYMISYVVTDSTGNRILYEYGVSVIDEIAPTVTFKSHDVGVYVGKSITLAELDITDDISSASNCEVYKYVQTVDGKRVSVGDSYTPNKAGVYEVWYYVYDESGNATAVSYTFTAV